MNFTVTTKTLIILLLMAVASCVEPYTPEGVSTNPDFLVVDGFINGSDNSAAVRLSRAVSLDAVEAPPPVSGAVVAVESEQGEKFVLTELGDRPGQYVGSDLPLNPARQYRLTINTGFGSSANYVSDYVEILATPVIDELFWRADEDGLKILVNTSEGDGRNKFYRWTYEETYEYTAPYSSAYLIENGEARLRRPDEFINVCYRTEQSTSIMVASSQNLVTTALKNYNVHTVRRGSLKLSKLYSINVKQQSLSEGAYTYWLNLFKTTENLGGLFDPMPGQVRGNIRSLTSPNELVIGYFSASSIEEKRIFISPFDLPDNYSIFRPPLCDLDTIWVEDIISTAPTKLLMGAIYQTGFPVVIGYTTSISSCLDCRVFGRGVTTKPDFWP